MSKREISNLDLKIKLTLEYLNNGGIQTIYDIGLLEDLQQVKRGPDGKADPDTISTRVNAFMMAILADHTTPPFYHSEYKTEYISTLQKSLSFDQENIDTEEQFNKIYNEFSKKTDTLFRGQGEARWRLYSKLQRNWLDDKLFKTENSYQELIEKLVANGKVEYYEQIKEILEKHHIDSENSISILGFLQQHKCPTPLLDWSFSFQNALFFALDDITPNPGTREINNYLSVYFLEEKYLIQANLRTFIEEGLEIEGKELKSAAIAAIAKDENEQKEMEEHFAGRSFFDMKKITGSGLIFHMTEVKHLMGFPILYFSDKDTDAEILFSINNSKNILNQRGVFIWNADSSKPLELVGNEMYLEGRTKKEIENYRFCNCINIHKSLVDHIRARLEADGITKGFIYPTPDLNTWEIFEKSKRK